MSWFRRKPRPEFIKPEFDWKVGDLAQVKPGVTFNPSRVEQPAPNGKYIVKKVQEGYDGDTINRSIGLQLVGLWTVPRNNYSTNRFIKVEPDAFEEPRKALADLTIHVIYI